MKYRRPLGPKPKHLHKGVPVRDQLSRLLVRCCFRCLPGPEAFHYTFDSQIVDILMTIIHLLAIDSSIIYLHPLHICFINNGMIIVGRGVRLAAPYRVFYSGSECFR